MKFRGSRRQFPPASESAKLQFASKLFDLHDGFRPTKSLYLDFEGSGAGHEAALGLYWPQRKGTERFRLLVSGDDDRPLSATGLKYALEDLHCACSEVNSVVVFSGGEIESDELHRFREVFGKNHVLAQKTWVNMHVVLRKSSEMKRSVRDHRYVRKIGRQMAHYSLEALEWEFGIRRCPDLRGHDCTYADQATGNMKILELLKRLRTGDGTDEDSALLEAYCRQDVESLFKVARESEMILRR